MSTVSQEKGKKTRAGKTAGRSRKETSDSETNKKGEQHTPSARTLSSKAGLSRPGASVHAGRDVKVGVRSAGTVPAPEQSVSGGKVPGRSIRVLPFSFSISG